MNRKIKGSKDIGLAKVVPRRKSMPSWRDFMYGRISGSAIENFLAMFDQVWVDRAGLKNSPSKEPLQARISKLAMVQNWADLYQCSLAEIIARIVLVSGCMEPFLMAIKSGDPVGEAKKVMDSIPDEPPDHPDALRLAFVMVGNLDAIARYSRSMADMLRAVRDQGDTESLLQAITIDSYVMTLPVVQAAIRFGQFQGDDSFTSAVFAAIRGPHKARFSYPRLRWMEYLLREQGAFETCSQDEIHDLIVYRLKLYDDDSKKKDSKKALFMLFRKWQKQAGN